MKKALSLILVFALAAAVFCLAGCGKTNEEPSNESAQQKIALADVLAKIKEQVGIDFEQVTYSADDLMDYYGIDASTAADFAVVVNASGYQDEIIMIEGNDSAAADEIASKLEQHLAYKKEEMDGYSPEMVKILDKCSVNRSGNTVALFISDKTEQMVSVFNSLVIG